MKAHPVLGHLRAPGRAASDGTGVRSGARPAAGAHSVRPQSILLGGLVFSCWLAGFQTLTRIEIRDELAPGAYAELPGDLGEVLLNGLCAHEQFFGDLPFIYRDGGGQLRHEAAITTGLRKPNPAIRGAALTLLTSFSAHPLPGV